MKYCQLFLPITAKLGYVPFHYGHITINDASCLRSEADDQLRKSLLLKAVLQKRLMLQSYRTQLRFRNRRLDPDANLQPT